jgi:ABC-type Zn2+ transport system substrate-binding protein/surface adhesin
MALLSGLNLANLSPADKAKLKKRLLEHKKALKKTSKNIDAHLKQLAAKKKKRKAKR